MLLKEEEDAGGGQCMYGSQKRYSYCNETSCINAISRNEKRKDEAAEDLGTFTHMRNGVQADGEAQEEADRARREINRELDSSSSLGGRCG